MDNHRTDIQGLRGVAVVLVVLFHFFPRWVPGGYVGVDVFFVVSGFLITHILLLEADKRGHPSLLSFFARRILRLLPASTLVLLCVAIGYSLFPFSMWESLGTHLRAAALFIVNFQFIAESTDYLAADSAPSALLHYWSLSVEEQFYLVWPLTLVVSWSFAGKRGVLLAALVLCCASFACSILLTPREPTIAYFAPWTRAWEFLMGALACMLTPRVLPYPQLCQWLPKIGLCVITASAFFLSNTSPFPGALAVFPCLGAILALFPVIRKTPADSWVACYPMRKLGDISYSLYLWHYPLLRLAESIDSPGLTVASAKAAAFFGAFFISFASKRFIEDPCRRFYRGEKTALRHILYSGLLMLSVTLAVGLFSKQAISNRFNQQLDLKSLHYKKARRDLARVYGHTCYQDYESENPEACVLGANQGRRRIALVGDSHAVQWAPALEILANRHNIRLELYGKMACGFAGVPLLRSGRAPYTTCSTWRQAVLRRLRENPPDLLLFSQARRQATPKKTSHEDIVVGIGRTLSQLEPLGVTILLLADTPLPSTDVPQCLLLRLDPKACAFSMTEGQRDKDAIVSYAQTNSFPLVDLTSVICPAGSCPALTNGSVVWRDAHHMTASFAETLAEPLREHIENHGWTF